MVDQLITAFTMVKRDWGKDRIKLWAYQKALRSIINADTLESAQRAAREALELS